MPDEQALFSVRPSLTLPDDQITEQFIIDELRFMALGTGPYGLFAYLQLPVRDIWVHAARMLERRMHLERWQKTRGAPYPHVAPEEEAGRS